VRRYNLIQPYWLSFLSKDLYRDVARNWHGFAFLYLLLLLALAWVPDIVRVQRGFSRYVDQESQALIAQIPKITITNGEVSLDPPGPHHIKDPESGKVIIVLDTAADMDTLEQFPDATILLTRTQVITRQAGRGQTRAQDLAGIQSFSIDQDAMRRLFTVLKSWLGILLYPFALLGSYVYRILQALLNGVIALGIAGLVKTQLEYSAAVRLAVMAVTPVIVVDTLLGIFSAKPPYWWWLCIPIVIWYLFFGVKAAAEAGTSPAPGSAPPPLRPAD